MILLNDELTDISAPGTHRADRLLRLAGADPLTHELVGITRVNDQHEKFTAYRSQDYVRVLPGAEFATRPQCWCQAPAYDGDDGWDRDCPQHGVDAAETEPHHPRSSGDAHG